MPFPETLRGRCLCGAVSYEATGPAREMWYCHCRECRKTSGIGFGAWIAVPDVRWISGEERVVRSATSPALTRGFCAQCGTVLPARRAGDGGAMLPAGGLESVGAMRPCGHVADAERLPWLPVLDENLPALPDSCDLATHARAPHVRAAPPGRTANAPVRGSCLCGAVAWEAARPLAAMRVCHCSRCRRRSGSNCFVGVMCRAGALRLLRGEEQISTWHMPGTRFYTTSFCKACGAAAPAILPKGSFVSAGCLDDDPAVRALCHIFYGSRASWVNAWDDLPRFEEFAPPGFDWNATHP
ncbi:MAG: GFA family protein [Steroidobacteraceae bacterium]|nr:GFA family protein [Steroidobacteraceae bacterium]MBP7012599.1 GFA family protein [Steroidobacteraceae bacterium]